MPVHQRLYDFNGIHNACKRRFWLSRVKLGGVVLRGEVVEVIP
jgi:hypothetical protein